MSLVNNIKSKAGKFYLKKALEKNGRKKAVVNYKNATSVGILYLVGEKEDLLKVKKFVQYLKAEEGIREVMALGYYPKKELPEGLTAKLNFEYFTKKEVNWHMRPENTSILQFVEKDYDILIDFSPAEIVPLRFILTESLAKFKVGRLSEENQEFYDFMIDTGENDPIDCLIEQANIYLKILNNSDEN